MAYRDLRAFIERLQVEGELKRIRAEVDPVLEITEIADRTTRAGGPALLFENPKGSKIPLLINALGSERRLNLALEVNEVNEIAERIRGMLDFKSPQGILEKMKMLPKLAELGSFFPKSVKSDPCKEVIKKENFSLSSPGLWFLRAIRKQGSAMSAFIACRFMTNAPPACTGRRKNTARNIFAALENARLKDASK